MLFLRSLATNEVLLRSNSMRGRAKVFLVPVPYVYIYIYINTHASLLSQVVPPDHWTRCRSWSGYPKSRKHWHLVPLGSMSSRHLCDSHPIQHTHTHTQHTHQEPNTHYDNILPIQYAIVAAEIIETSTTTELQCTCVS